MMVAPQSPDCPDENELVMSMHGLLTPNRSRTRLTKDSLSERHLSMSAAEGVANVAISTEAACL